MHKFLWEWDYRAGMDAEHLVEKFGVKVVAGSRVIPKRAGDLVGFSVPDHQAHWAEYLLCRAGYALAVPLLDPSHQQLLLKALNTGASRPTGGSRRIKRHGIIDRFWHIADEIVGIGESGRNRMMPGAQSWRPERNYMPAKEPSFIERLFGRLFVGDQTTTRKDRY